MNLIDIKSPADLKGLSLAELTDPTVVAIRVPVGEFVSTGVVDTTDYSILHKSQVTRRGERIALLGLGNFYHLANQVADELAKDGINATVVNHKFASGLVMMQLNC